jgi:class 3 adenylate cyclase/tetratricopeptide (TPR) repeat protein
MTRRERKVVTVLFADLVGFTARAEQLDPEDVEAILRPYHERLRSELQRFGGTVEKFIGDAVMALFGAPVAHEDDPERAVRAALAIRDWARAEDAVHVRIAVNTGEALINLDARSEAGEGMAAGDVVNTTARLQAAAPANGVIVGETTYRATRQSIDFRAHEPVEAKGKAEPVSVWEAVDARARVGTEAVSTRVALVGRSRELDQLLDLFERVRQEHSPQLVTLVGVPGIGKSRLVLELSSILDNRPDLVYWRHGRSLPYGEGVTFWALAEIVKAQAGILETDSAEEAEQKLATMLTELVHESEASWLALKLKPLVGLAAEAELGGDRRAESFAAWRRFFEALADQRPLVLVFEDLHWADEDLLDFVDELADWIEGVPLLVLCTARPELLERRPGWAGGKRNAATISLAPLDDESTARLIAGLLGRAVLPAETQAALLARAGGNPLYAEQFVRMAEEGSANGGDLPETVQGLIAARLDSLPQEEKALLQDAAVFGKVFWAGAVEAIGGADRSGLEERLRGLTRKEFVRRELRSTIERETQYSFGHLIVRDVAYGQIPRAARARKHQLAAEWIHSVSPDRSEDRSEMLAHHYLSALELAAAAGLDTEALRAPARSALRDGGDRAFALGSFRQAADLYAKALELWPDDDAEWPEILLQREQAIAEHGDEPNPAELEAALARFIAAGNTELAAEAEMALARSAFTRGEGELVVRHRERALELVEHAPASSIKAFVLTEAARYLMLGFEWERARVIGGQALEMTEQLGLDRLHASGLITIGTTVEDGSGIPDIERGIEIARRVNDSQQLQRGLNNLAEMLMQEGEFAPIGPLFEEMRKSAERFGGNLLIQWLDAQEGGYRWHVGDWKSATPLLDRFLARVETGSPHYQEQSARQVRAQIRYARGDTAGALEDAEKGLAAARAAKDPQALLSIILYARLLVAEDRPGEALALAHEAVAPGYLPYYVAVDLAWVLTDAGDRSDELHLPEVHEPWSTVMNEILTRDFRTVADQLGNLGLRTDEAFARLRAASDLVAAGRRAEADEQLQRALAFYRSVGATRYVREGEALLAASA